MMEFTISRLTLCICGVILLASVGGVLTAIYDNGQDSQDDILVQRISHMLDVFESSDVDEMILDGNILLPKEYHINVHDNFVELSDGESTHISGTEYNGSFNLGWNDVISISHRRSLRS